MSTPSHPYFDPSRRPAGAYDPFPSHPLASGSITRGTRALAERLASQEAVVIDGFVGVQWHELRVALEASLGELGVATHWVHVDEALRQEDEVERLIRPFLGGDDPLFGRRFDGELSDFFDARALRSLQPRSGMLSILYGSGAALAGWDALLLYVELPKDTLQRRARAGLVTNLGRGAPESPKNMYKRFYFVDWPVLNRHKERLLPRIDLVLDGQDAGDPSFMEGQTLREALDRLSRTHFRVRPWFEPGPWGGQWLKQMIPDLPRDVPNYAWSFELITPENGLVFESGSERLEVSFDTLMYRAGAAVLGEHVRRFGSDFPIRFDYLDTMAGGNLSVQCHPRPDFIRSRFGEPFTQDETYYIVDCSDDAVVYLGFHEGVDPDEFRSRLEESAMTGAKVDVERFVRRLPAERHGLYLIPNGTIHCSGANNLVLEISATPYIFTFKMYDWGRLDLDGKPRPLNLERAFENLDFSRQGAVVEEELVSRPVVASEGNGWRLVRLPTHPEHFYDVDRLEVTGSCTVRTDGSPHVLNVVEGGPVLLRAGDGNVVRFHFAETFVVPAAAGEYTLVNEGPAESKVVKAYLKRTADDLERSH